MRRFIAFICAFVILLACVPAFAAESFNIWDVAGIYAGSFDTAMSQTRYADAWQYVVDNATGNLAGWLSDTYHTFGVVTYVDYSGYKGEARIVFFRSLSSFDELRFSSDDDTLKTRPYNTVTGATASTSNFVRLQVRADATDWANGTFTNKYGLSADTSGPYISPLLKPSNTYTQQDLYLDQSIPLYDTATSQIVPYPVPGYNGTVNFSLNPGNVLVFERSGGFTGLDPLTVSGTSLPKSLGWLEKTWSTGVTYGPSLAYPSTSTNLTENYLFWDKVPGTQNLWGITTSGTGSIPIQGPNDFFWIVNPIGVYRNSKWVNNPPITITFNPSDFDAVYLTPMINMDGMAYIPESFDPIYKKYKIDFNADTGDTSYTDTSTDTSVPSADANRPGGLNGYDDVEDGAIGETVSGILGILQSGARAIESLVSGARSFFEALNSMYDWLPDDVQTILKASLFLVFAVGVIKVLH